MIWNNICSEVDKGKTYIDYFIHKGPSGGMELMLQDLVGFGKSYHSLNMYPLGGYDSILDDRLGWQLIDPAHSCWCINLNILAGKQVLYLKEVIYCINPM